MNKVLRFFVTIEFALVIGEIVFHPTWLPLGGEHPVQIAACLGLAVIVDEFFDLFVREIVRRRADPSRSISDRRLEQRTFEHTAAVPYVGRERRHNTDRRRPSFGGRRVSDQAPPLATS